MVVQITQINVDVFCNFSYNWRVFSPLKHSTHSFCWSLSPPLSTITLEQFSCLQWTTGDAPDHSGWLGFGQTPGGICCCTQGSSTRMKEDAAKHKAQPQQQFRTNPRGVYVLRAPLLFHNGQLLAASWHHPQQWWWMEGILCQCHEDVVSPWAPRCLVGRGPVEQTSLSYKSQIWSL